MIGIWKASGVPTKSGRSACAIRNVLSQRPRPRRVDADAAGADGVADPAQVARDAAVAEVDEVDVAVPRAVEEVQADGARKRRAAVLDEETKGAEVRV